MVAWYIYAGGVTITLILFIYLATRRNYRDPTAAQNYEKIRNKLTTRKLLEPKEEEYEDSGFNLQSLILGIVVIGITITVGFSILDTMTAELANMTTATNVTTEMTDQLTTMSNFIPLVFIVMIAGIILTMISKAFSNYGEVGL